MNSRYIRISTELLLEFVASASEKHDTDVRLRRITSEYDGTCTLYNEKGTGNSIDKVHLITDRYDTMAVGEEGGKLSESNTLFRDEKCDLRFYDKMKYNKVRLHLLCGYNLQNIEGLGINLFIRDTEKVFNLADIVIFSPRIGDVTYARSPKRITESVFDRYIEFDIISIDDILEYSRTDEEMVKRMFGQDMVIDSVLHVETYEIRNLHVENGFKVFQTYNKHRSSFPIGNEYKSLSAELRFSEDKTCVEFSGSFEGMSFEDFMYRLNSMSKNSYFVQHEIRVVEQVGNSFIEQDTWVTVQNTDFDKIFKFRPVIENKGVISVSIDYRMTLMNAYNANGMSVEASISTRDIQSFQGKLVKLQAPIQNIRVVQKIARSSDKNIREVSNDVIKTKYVTKYVNVTDITTDKKDIHVTPFRSTYRINLKGVESQNNNHRAFLVYVDDYGQKHYMKNVVSEELSAREYMFIMEENTSVTILKNANRKLYFVIIENDVENVIDVLNITT